MLQINDLRKHFGHVPVLSGVSFDLPAGGFGVIVGPNGAGKSTLLNCISMVLRPSGGTILFEGREIFSHALDYRRALGYIAHYLFLYGELTGIENLRFYARLYHLDPAGDIPLDSLRAMGLFPHRNRPVRTYSRGMKQRLAIARALLHQPRLILLDEPFTGLDQHASSILRDLLLRLNDEGRTVLMISHHLEHALELGSKILVLVRGKLRADLTAEAARGTPFREYYLDLVDRFENENRKE